MPLLQGARQSCHNVIRLNQKIALPDKLPFQLLSLSLMMKKIPSKLEVAPNALKMLDGVGEWMDGYPLDCYDY